ncbi:hypothetical protein [uncultured Polaribacter sp.]|uniref:hypothetical protein n=1 Tax=uncultured Polaribacter sp. TaxID=174711 RepID=UPI00260339C1|nr:hypothetical protein [uncultured Polaribacter sp.]
MKINKLIAIFLLTIFTFLGCKTNQFLKNNISTKDYVFIEGEKTASDLQKWQLVKKGDKNYVKRASGAAYLEFMGNKPITGKPNSPLIYQFTAPKTGDFQLMLMSSKRLEGVKSDWCNDAFIRLSGKYESGSKLSKKALQKNIKILQDGNDETPELQWHWASTAEKDRHVYNKFIYKLIKGEKYKITLSGRSKRFSVDYIILYNTAKFSNQEAKELFKF